MDTFLQNEIHLAFVERQYRPGGQLYYEAQNSFNRYLVDQINKGIQKYSHDNSICHQRQVRRPLQVQQNGP